jgi:hypothetical protein
MGGELPRHRRGLGGYEDKVLVPTLRRGDGDIVVMDNLPAHKVACVEQAIEAAKFKERPDADTVYPTDLFGFPSVEERGVGVSWWRRHQIRGPAQDNLNENGMGKR